MSTKSTLLLSILLIAAFLLSPYFIEWQNYKLTERLVMAEAQIMLHRRSPPTEERKDLWGTPLRYEYEATEYVLTATVTSLGPDKIVSEDDVVGERTDLNKSKVIGYWAGTRFKEVREGFLEGLRAKSPFRAKGEEK